MQKEMNIKIDRFLCGEMLVDEQNAFEKEMLHNSELATEVQLHREVGAVLSDPHQLDFLNTINQLNKKFSDQTVEKPGAEIIPITQNKSVLRTLWPKMLAVASVAVVVFGLFYMFSVGPKPMTSGLYTSYNTPPDFYANENVMGGTTEESFSGIGLFNAKKYNAAIPQLEAELKNAPDNISLKFMLAYANSEIGNDSVAINDFDELLKHEDFLLLDEIKWYKALHLLKMGKEEECLKVIDDISDEFLDMEDRRELQKELRKTIK